MNNLHSVAQGGLWVDRSYYEVPASFDGLLPETQALLPLVVSESSITAYQFAWPEAAGSSPEVFKKGDQVIFDERVPLGIQAAFGVEEEPLTVIRYVESDADTLLCVTIDGQVTFPTDDGHEPGYAEVVAFSWVTRQCVVAPSHVFKRA